MIKIGNIKAYDVQEVSSILKVSPQTVRKYIHTGTLKAQKAGARYVITEQTLKDYITGAINKK